MEERFALSVEQRWCVNILVKRNLRLRILSNVHSVSAAVAMPGRPTSTVARQSLAVDAVAS